MTKKTVEIDSSERLAELLIEGLTDLKGQDIVMLDLREITQSVCDFFIIVTGTSSTHVGGLADSAEKKVKENGGDSPWHVEGYQQGDWVLLDYVDVVVHIFRAEAREFYALEKLWADASFRRIA